MKSSKRNVAALLAAFLWMPVGNAEPSRLEQALRQGEVHRPLILAQSDRPRPTCKDDEKDLPRGATTCRNGRVMLCNPRGNWEDTKKPC